jgi:ABC-type multidrug transport system permease subunit
MQPLSLLTVIPFVVGIVAIKKYKWIMGLFNKLFSKREKQFNQIELKAKIIASSIFVILWSIIGFVLTFQ